MSPMSLSNGPWTTGNVETKPHVGLSPLPLNVQQLLGWRFPAKKTRHDGLAACNPLRNLEHNSPLTTADMGSLQADPIQVRPYMLVGATVPNHTERVHKPFSDMPTSPWKEGPVHFHLCREGKLGQISSLILAGVTLHLNSRSLPPLVLRQLHFSQPNTIYKRAYSNRGARSTG